MSTIEQVLSVKVELDLRVPQYVDKWIDGSHNSGTVRQMSESLLLRGLLSMLRDAGLEGSLFVHTLHPAGVRCHI